jgi:hypothetical protein
MNVVALLRKALTDMGADGLSDGDECGCVLADLAPCGEPGLLCVAAENRGSADSWQMWPIATGPSRSDETEPGRGSGFVRR